MKTTTTSTR